MVDGAEIVTPRRGRLLLLGILVAAVVLLSGAALRDTFTFYRTPSEVLTGRDAGARVRVGGEVVPGSLHSEGGRTVFRLRDGLAQVPVEQDADLPGTIREGQEAVVEGVVGTDGVLRSDTVMAKHGNEYRPAGEAAVR